MTQIAKRMYQNRVALNVLAKDIANAKDVFAAAEGHVLVGVLSKDYATVPEAVEAMQACGREIDDAVSIGLGGGDSRQATMVAEIAKHYSGSHINQAFAAVGATRANLGNRDGWINSMVAPTGKPGYVNISIGPISSAEPEQAIVPVQAAIALVRDMGGNALKYFPMQGLKREEELRAVAKACAAAGFALEPTGGIDLDNFAAILRITLEAGVPQVIPHVYTSIIDPVSGRTNPSDVEVLHKQMVKLADQYA